MSTVWLFGAGASRGYAKSRRGVHPPLATDYFSTFQKLQISGDLEVKIGAIVNYLRDTRGIPPERQGSEFDENIETVFSELDRTLRAAFDRGAKVRGDVLARFNLTKAYDQLVFWFAHVLNEVQNGEPCPIYARVVSECSPGDVLVPFNWDTILDRALDASGDWYPDDGYGTSFDGILDGVWRKPAVRESKLKLLKLHGSTNWFGPYVSRQLQSGERQWATVPGAAYKHWCLRGGSARFSTYKDRWRPGYQPYSYFFPPNDPIADLPLMPVIIPPTEAKMFNEYTDLLQPVWDAAEAAMESSERLMVAGYSFPRTDTHAYSLLEAFARREGKRIEIIDPYPDGVAERVRGFVRQRCETRVHPLALGRYLGEPEVRLTGDEPEAASSVFVALVGGNADENARRHALLQLLGHCNLHGVTFDLTTHDGRRFLNASLRGEFVTHLYGAFHPEVFEYRITNIPITSEAGEEVSISLHDLWIVHPLRPEPISQEEIDGADVEVLDEEMKRMIREGYHCKDEKEADYFYRRFVCS